VKTSLFILLFILFFWTTRAQKSIEKGNLNITYISNAGFLISSTNHKILFDALFSYGSKYIGMMTPLIIDGRAPFNNIDLLLLSHYHSDHCDPGLINRYLAAHRRVKFVASKPAISFINGVCYDFILRKKQFLVMTPPMDKSLTAISNGIEIKAFGLKHNSYIREGIDMNESMLNVSYLVNLDGIKVFHSGDIRTSSLKSYLEANGKWTEKVDVAILCYSLFEDGQDDLDLILDTLKPEYIVVMHVPDELTNECRKRISDFKQSFSNIMFLQNPMDSVVLDFKHN
jgi:L-ascorbate metabolism protein UlaG (beta-lactamase superfamily)